MGDFLDNVMRWVLAGILVFGVLPLALTCSFLCLRELWRLL